MASKRSVEQLILLIFESSRVIREWLEFPFSVIKVQTMRFIKAGKGPTMHEVADYLRITPPSATSLIQGMEREKLVRKTYDPKDRRIVHLALTKKGQAAVDSASRWREKQMHSVLGKLSNQEIRNFHLILEKIVQHYRK